MCMQKDVYFDAVGLHTALPARPGQPEHTRQDIGERVLMSLNEGRGWDGGSKAWLIPSLTPFSG